MKPAKVKKLIKLYKTLSPMRTPKHARIVSYTHNSQNCSPKEKEILKNQNKLIQNIATQVFPSAKKIQVSRDKKGHPILLVLDFYPNRDTHYKLNSYMLGINTKTYMPELFLINECVLKYDKVNNDLYVSSLSTHPTFDNLGIGRLALQESENIALQLDCKTMSICSLKTYILNPGIIKSNNKLLESKKSYFDKNYYFYSTQGFEEYGDQSIDYKLGCRSLKKATLTKQIIDFGVCLPAKKMNKLDPEFSMENEDCSASDYADLYDYLPESQLLSNIYPYENHFKFSNNKISSEYFAPFILTNTETSTKMLEEIINNQIFTNSKGSKLKYMLLEILLGLGETYSTSNKTYNHIFEHICLNEDFINSQIVSQSNNDEEPEKN